MKKYYTFGFKKITGKVRIPIWKNEFSQTVTVSICRGERGSGENQEREEEMIRGAVLRAAAVAAGALTKEGSSSLAPLEGGPKVRRRGIIRRRCANPSTFFFGN